MGCAVTAFLSAAACAFAAPALADPVPSYDVWDYYLAMPCHGFSPNLLDLPYNGGIRLQTVRTAPGIVTFMSDSKSIFGYTTDAVIDWHNLDNGRSGSIPVTYQHALTGPSGFVIPGIDTGTGRLRVSVTAVNHGFATLDAPTCSGEETL
ncbi:hypothetical protein GCM10023318_00650 [Nocardia callitridis]|uniref:Uncharacterized protein n=2 Tax=Nocardia callitridis TaxID=648753 RepID=A0ABP9JSA4_9NOCA